MSTFFELGDYVAACAGVSPWTVGKVYREFRQHDVRLDVLGTAFLVEHENPGVPPALLWKRTIKAWLKVVKISLGMTGRGGCSADRRFAAVDAAADLSQVVDASCDAFREAEILEDFEKSSRITALVVVLLGDLGKALADGKAMDEAATECGISLATAYRKVDRVREMLAA